MKSKTASVPYGIWMTIFIVVPMILVVVFAFTDKSGHFTLDNIMAVGQYSNVFLRSIWLGAIATVICLVLGYPLAYIISHTGARAPVSYTHLDVYKRQSEGRQSHNGTGSNQTERRNPHHRCRPA